MRKATLADSKAIQQLISDWAKQGKVIERSLNYVYEHIRDFWVYTDGEQILGCCSFSVVGWQDLGEIKSLVVANDAQGRGIGTELVKKSIAEAGSLGVKKIFALTFVPGFFEKLGFKKANRKELPHKIWNDCINCLSFPDCGEEAVVLEIKI